MEKNYEVQSNLGKIWEVKFFLQGGTTFKIVTFYPMLQYPLLEFFYLPVFPIMYHYFHNSMSRYCIFIHSAFHYDRSVF